ncbi:MAG: polysaccharide lyase family 1 protein [Paracoccus sp. (in: a-proteobacteria)]
MPITDRIKAAIRHGMIMSAMAAFMFVSLIGGPVVAAEVAFPGAVGYGAVADGWRGGRLIPVTNLKDHGPGSLRNCVERDGPRICVFRISGTIRLNGPLMARSDLYIAGQTAPGTGIQLRLGNSRHGPLIIKNAQDVVVRFLKLRPGVGTGKTSNIDALTVENASRLYLGNLSLMFATDETFNIHVVNGTATDITLADSILAYSLDRANHPKGRHSKGALICSGDGQDNACGRISLLRNIFAHHRDRNPDIKATAAGPVEVINNIFYNPISQFGEFYDLLGNTRIAYIGNLALTGPSTITDITAAVELFDWAEGHEISVWMEDNIAQDCRSEKRLPVADPVAVLHKAKAPVETTIPAMPASMLARTLPGQAGDILPGGNHRDKLDQRVVTELARCEGQVIDRPGNVGGWTHFAAVRAAPDSDGDLLPDAWERKQTGLDPMRADNPWRDPDGDGLSAVEDWLAELAGDQ